MDVNPTAPYIERMHTTLVNRLMRHAGYDVDGSIDFAWHLARQLANGNVYFCIFAMTTILSYDTSYYLRYTRPQDGDRIMTLFGLSTLIISHVLCTTMVCFNLLIRNSVLPNVRHINGWLSAHSSILNFFVVHEICVYRYVGGSFECLVLGQVFTVIMLFEAFVFVSLRRLLTYRTERDRHVN